MENINKHKQRKKQLKQINSRTKFEDILNDSMLSELEKEMMKMYYIEKKDLNYIADTLGYSRSGITKMHKRILTNIETLL